MMYHQFVLTRSCFGPSGLISKWTELVHISFEVSTWNAEVTNVCKNIVEWLGYGSKQTEIVYAAKQ
jgi:hypothetical protein